MSYLSLNEILRLINKNYTQREINNLRMKVLSKREQLELIKVNNIYKFKYQQVKSMLANKTLFLAPFSSCIAKNDTTQVKLFNTQNKWVEIPKNEKIETKNGLTIIALSTNGNFLKYE